MASGSLCSHGAGPGKRHLGLNQALTWGLRPPGHFTQIPRGVCTIQLLPPCQTVIPLPESRPHLSPPLLGTLLRQCKLKVSLDLQVLPEHVLGT